MNESALKAAEKLIPKTYLQQAVETRKIRERKIRILMEQRKCPEEGWDDATIELLIDNLALMDSNNFPHNCGVGEREARVYSDLVNLRHYRLGHGIGRSGDLAEVQPKAAGSSLLYKLSNAVVLDIIKSSGAQKAAACLVVPLATGMTITLCLLTLRHQRPTAKYVIWPRIDQKSCFKAITTAGFEAIVVENLLEGDELRTDVEEIEHQINKLGKENVVAVITTTSCFAPRGIDKLEEVSKLCATAGVPHLINNAYGVQATKCMHHIEQSLRFGRVDAFIQSTDKNFMVPVGGAVVAGPDPKFIEDVGKMYPGRASSSPILDVLITLLSMGCTGYKNLVDERKTLRKLLQNKMKEVAEKHGLRVLETKNNPISIGWGSHSINYPNPYITAAAAIGMSQRDVELFIQRLDKTLEKFTSPQRRSSTQFNQVCQNHSVVEEEEVEEEEEEEEEI
ncbi:sec synthetase isoform X2 [Oratosquilla oratoria]|uniref:sec synthetase isoform X2 n=1 Tax=Oratosquilla oratoria TaxID=337810 RepID=UPI003F76174D